jgi:superfamily II DNA or RNA helicase
LGLSATPKRWFDEQGTDFLFKYFDDVVFEFDLWNAINTINPSTGKTFLVPYKYFANYISLNGEEINEYVQLCSSISKLYNRSKFGEDYEARELMERLIFKRADLIKNADNKFDIFEKLIDEIGEEIGHTLIYCSPQQIQKLRNILMKKGIISHSFTMKEGTKPDAKFGGISERDHILKKFEEGEYQTLVAMKCLDEGVNIPPARRAILMASSGNPKEYIQRIGRILRRYPNKDLALIYDIVVVPSISKIPLDMRELETKIFNKELARYEEIAKNALNNVDALAEVYKLKS